MPNDGKLCYYVILIKMAIYHSFDKRLQLHKIII